MDHDQRFKVLLKEFFRECFLLFFPAWMDRFDFANVTWLDKQMFPNPPEGRCQELDLVARVPVRHPPRDEDEGADQWLVLVNIEIEAEDRVAPLRRRIFEYAQFLRWQHRLPVLPIGFFLRVGLEGVGWDAYEDRFWEHTLVRFTYPYIGLPRLDGEAYLRGESLLGVALAVLMRLPEERRLELGSAAWHRLIQSPENEYRKMLLCDCVSAYLPRNDAESEEFEQRVRAVGESGEQAMTTSMFERIHQRGLHEGQRRSLLSVLEARFGPLSEVTRQRVTEIAADQLDGLLRAAANAASLQELGLQE